ncbi:MAG: hypothetical protein ACFFBP_18110 [Promethearchaeota archaeon]
MPIELRNPPAAILASGSKEGVDLGGQKCFLSIDGNQNLINEANFITEMSWGSFYNEEGLEDQIDSFTTVEYYSYKDDPDALAKTITNCLNHIIENQRLFYGIADFEVDAFMNENTVIPGLKLDYKIINELLIAHRKIREENLFPQIISDAKGKNAIRIEFQGAHQNKVHLIASKLENLADMLRTMKGFVTGIVCTSKGAANLYIMTDNIVFKDNEFPEMYIDQENIDIIMLAIQREILFPISWFRIDVGLKSLETLELWNQIKNNPLLKNALENYERYITALIYKKFKNIASTEHIGIDLQDDFENLTIEERNKALRDMADAIRKLTELYKE